MLAAINSDGYKVVLVLHIFCVVVGLGTVFLNGVYGAKAKARRGPEGLAIVQATFGVSLVADWFIYAIFPLGIALVFMSKTSGVQVYDWDQTWIWLSMLLYVVALGLSHGMLRPAIKRMQLLMAEMTGAPPLAGGPPPQAAEMEQLGKRVAAVGGTLNVFTVVLITLMVWKPGF